MPEPVIVPHEQVVHPEAAEQNLVDKTLGAERGQGRRERQHSSEVESRFGEHFEFLLAHREKQWRRRRIHHLERMRIERHEQAVDPQFACSRDQLS